MAHTKSAGSTALGRDSEAKRLGVKLSDGQWANVGAIIVRQRGTKVHPGKNVLRGGDDTLFAAAAGTIRFRTRARRRFDGRLIRTNVVNVEAKA